MEVKLEWCVNGNEKEKKHLLDILQYVDDYKLIKKILNQIGRHETSEIHVPGDHNTVSGMAPTLLWTTTQHSIRLSIQVAPAITIEVTLSLYFYSLSNDAIDFHSLIHRVISFRNSWPE